MVGITHEDITLEDIMDTNLEDTNLVDTLVVVPFNTWAMDSLNLHNDAQF